MRKFGYPFAAITMCIAVFSSCQNDLLDDVEEVNREPLTRQVNLAADVQEEQTRAAYDADGAFIWSATDAISVFDGSNFYKLDLTDGNGTRFATFSGTIGEADPQFALYPYNSDHKLSSKGKLKFNFPSVYDNYVCGESNTPMYATITSIDGGASFTHLGATIRIKLSGVPTGVKKVTVSTDVNLSGESTLTIAEGSASLDVPDGGRAVTYTLENATAENDNLVFDVPVLAGAYKMFSVDARDADGVILKTFNFIKETEVERAHIKPYNINYTTSTSGTAYVDNGVPQLVLQTPGKVGITSKEEYVEGSMVSLKGVDGETEFTGEMKTKGRGNSTWGAPKKPYKIKFDKKQSLFGEPKDKEWVLLANYYDKSMIRSDVAYWMASNFGQFDYVPRFHFVDLMLNGKYNGTYQLGDQLKIGENRVNVGDDGFLLEIDAKAAAEDITFKVPHISQKINIKDPDVVMDDDNYNFVKDYVTRADAALFASNWLDEENGYKSLIDMQSFAEWYVMMELTKNNDAAFYTSCYMNLSRTGKLKMGPLWDFDVSLGGYPSNWGRDFVNDPEGYYIKTNTGSWIARLFNDPAFVDAVKAAYVPYYNNKAAIIAHVESIAAANKKSAIANNKLWGTLCDKNSEDDVVEAAYDAQIDYLKNWISTRIVWLKSAFDEL